MYNKGKGLVTRKLERVNTRRGDSMKKMALVYGFSKDKQQVIQNTAAVFGIEVRILSSSDLTQKIGYLMGMDGYGEEEREDIQRNMEFILFSDFDREQLRDFTFQLKRQGIPTPYKSVLTATNRNWTLKDLMEHIEEEHRVMTKWNQLGQYVKEAQLRYRNTGSRDPYLAYAIESCMELKHQEVSEEIIDTKIDMIQKILKEK